MRIGSNLQVSSSMSPRGALGAGADNWYKIPKAGKDCYSASSFARTATLFNSESVPKNISEVSLTTAVPKSNGDSLIYLFGSTVIQSRIRTAYKFVTSPGKTK